MSFPQIDRRRLLRHSLVVFGLLGGLGWGVYELSGPAYEWAQKAPQTMRRLERKLREFKKPVQTMSKATVVLARLTAPSAATTAMAPRSSSCPRFATGAAEGVAAMPLTARDRR